MPTKTPLFCKFVIGPRDYADLDARPLVLEQLEYERTLVKARVSHASGEWVKWGTAYEVEDEITLWYETACKDEIAFERYATTLEFYLTGTPFDPNRKFHLTHDPNGAKPRDISAPNDFDIYATGFDWVYDNSWSFDGAAWESYSGPAAFQHYQLLRHPPAHTVLIRKDLDSQQAVWSGDIRTNLDFDAMLKATGKFADT